MHTSPFSPGSSPLSLHHPASSALPPKSFHYFHNRHMRFCSCGYTHIHVPDCTCKRGCIYHRIHLLCCYILFLSAFAHRASQVNLCPQLATLQQSTCFHFIPRTLWLLPFKCSVHQKKHTNICMDTQREKEPYKPWFISLTLSPVKAAA